MSQDNGVSPEEYATMNPIASMGGLSTARNTGVSEGYLPPPRLRRPVGGAEAVRFEREGTIQPQFQRVSGIVSPNNEQLPFYDLANKPGELLGTMDDVSRKSFIRTLYSRGWYGDKEPEGGLGDNDIEATRNLLYYSNLQGVTWDTIFNAVRQAPIAASGSGRTVQVTSTEDLTELANKVALSTIGRKLNDGEAAQFAKAYQGAQRGQSDTMAVTSPSVFFQQRLEEKYGAESEGYKYLSAISNVAKVLGGL